MVAQAPPVASAGHAVPYPSADQKRRKLRVAIITGEFLAIRSRLCLGSRSHAEAVCKRLAENFLPKVDGVTRTLARLLEHLNAEGHEAIVCGPETGIVSHLRYDAHSYNIAIANRSLIFHFRLNMLVTPWWAPLACHSSSTPVSSSISCDLASFDDCSSSSPTSFTLSTQSG